MKIFERILENRIREIVGITVNQAGFVKNCRTIDAIHAARLLMEKHREKHPPLYIAFPDLEKAFDRVSQELIWYALRQHLLPEELVHWVPKVQSMTGVSKPLRVSVAVTERFKYLGSTLSANGKLRYEIASHINAT